MASSDFDPKRTVLLSKQVITSATAHQFDAPSPRQFEGTAELNVHAPEHVTVTTDANQQGWVVISRTWNRNWHGWVDGKPAPLYQANGVHCAVPMPAGTHLLELRYVDRAFQLSALVSAIAWAGSLGGLVLPRRKRRA
jgi:hypothetical protein